MDPLEYMQWMRAVWEARQTCHMDLGVPSDLIRESLPFFNEWMESLLHVGREFDDAP